MREKSGEVKAAGWQRADGNGGRKRRGARYGNGPQSFVIESGQNAVSGVADGRGAGIGDEGKVDASSSIPVMRSMAFSSLNEW